MKIILSIGIFLITAITSFAQVKTTYVDKLRVKQGITLGGQYRTTWPSAGTDTTKVPLTRTLTINGVTLDLSANRSWTVSGGAASMVNVKDAPYNAIGNNVNDDYEEIQAAIDYAIANNVRTVFIPKGTYKVSKPLMLYKWDGSLYQFFSVSLLGESTFWDIGAGTVINYTGTEFALGIQLGKGVVIKGIVLNGLYMPPNPTYVSGGNTFFDNPTFYNLSSTAFNVGAGWKFGVHNSGSGIIIDPFTGAAGRPADTLAHINGVNFYRGQNNNSGSTGTVIEDMQINGFPIGINSAPNAVTRNAEITLIDKVQFGAGGRGLKYCISGGQDQEKANIARNIFVWEKCHTVFVTGKTGAQTPGNWYIENVNTAGNVIQLFDFSQGGYFPTYIRNVYAESVARWGTTVSGAGGSAMNCMVDFNEPQYIGYQTAYINSNMSFYDCTFRIYGSVLPLPITGAASYENCVFSGMPFSLTTNDADRPRFNNSGAGVPGYGANDQTLDGSTWSYSLNPNPKNNLNTFSFLYDNDKWKSPAIGLNEGGGTATVSKPAGAVATITVTGIAVGGNDYQIGRLVKFNDSLANECLGYVSARNEAAGTMTVSQISTNVVTGSFAFYAIVYYPFIDAGRFIGNYAENSTTVTQVKRYSGLGTNRIIGNIYNAVNFSNGNSFYNGTKAFARVRSIAGDTTLTWGNGLYNFGYTKTQATFGNGVINRYYIIDFNGGTQQTINNWLGDEKIFGKGDEIIIGENSDYEVKLRCTVGGRYTNGGGYTPLGTFVAF